MGLIVVTVVVFVVVHFLVVYFVVIIRVFVVVELVLPFIVVVMVHQCFVFSEVVEDSCFILVSSMSFSLSSLGQLLHRLSLHHRRLMLQQGYHRHPHHRNPQLLHRRNHLIQLALLSVERVFKLGFLAFWLLVIVVFI